MIAALAGVDDKHGLGRINAAVKRALFSAETAFHSVSFGAGRVFRAEEENAVCFCFTGKGSDDSGCGSVAMPGSGKGGRNAFCFFSRVAAVCKAEHARVRCCMLDACTAEDAIVFVVVFCYWCWCYLGQAYPGCGSALHLVKANR